MPDLAIHLGRADEIKVVGEENGFELHFTTDEGERYILNVHSVSEQLLKEAREVIGTYWAEGRFAAAEYRRLSRSRDQDAYPADDPKHPEFHSTHADLWDARSGK